MLYMLPAALILFLFLCCLVRPAKADSLVYEDGLPKGTVIGDALSGSPALAPRGPYAIGVRTLHITHPGQVDLAAETNEDPRPRYGRPLTVEVWYPCIAAGKRQACTYTDYIGRSDQAFLEAFRFEGRAVRDAEPYAPAGPLPVLIISHGYPGSRFLMSNLAENLATKGYAVFSVAHTDNTYTDFNPDISLVSAVVNRTLDQRWMVTELERLNGEGFLRGMLDTDRVGMIGYSFGGFGLLRTLGVRLNEEAFSRMAGHADLISEEADYRGDKRVRAAALFAPFGADLFDENSFACIDVPTFWLQGREDTVVPYGPVHGMWDRAVRSDRYFLTYDLMNHKVAPNPSPAAAQKYGFAEGARRWDDWVWNQWHVNGINFHFLTAFFDARLKGETEKLDYLNVREPVGRRCVYSMKDGVPAPEHTYWPGFDPNGTTMGLTLEHASAV
ncbi:MAG: dienelactone hydrolase [Clostridia bacterium]|nr:dienelactone hydrolase [Clostridia bacterium]